MAIGGHHHPCAHPAKLQVPGGDSDEESKTPSASPRHGRSRPSSSVQESSSESEDGDSRGEVGGSGPLENILGRVLLEGRYRDEEVQGQDPREEVLESECTIGPQEMHSWLEGRNW